MSVSKNRIFSLFQLQGNIQFDYKPKYYSLKNNSNTINNNKSIFEENYHPESFGHQKRIRFNRKQSKFKTGKVLLNWKTLLLITILVLIIILT